MTTEEAMKRLINDWFIALSGQLCVDMDKKDTFLEAVGMGVAALRAQAEAKKNAPAYPCDLCMYNPPSSFGGKPCFACPATGKPEEAHADD